MKKFFKFFQEAYQELKLATWLTRQQMIGHTIIVLVLTAFMAIYVGVVDRILLFFAKILLLRA